MMMKQTLIAFLCGLSIWLSVPVQAHADEPYPASTWTQTEPYTEKIGHKLGYGFLNFATGWTALFFEPYRHNNLTSGLADGIVKTVVYSFGGAVHMLTFPIPVDVPLPAGGVSFSQDKYSS